MRSKNLPSGNHRQRLPCMDDHAVSYYNRMYVAIFVTILLLVEGG
jgi:hypothetical protein